MVRVGGPVRAPPLTSVHSFPHHRADPGQSGGLLGEKGSFCFLGITICARNGIRQILLQTEAGSTDSFQLRVELARILAY